MKRAASPANPSDPAAAGSAAAARPVSVLVVTAERRDVSLFLDGLGNALPLATVIVKSQVDGRLDKVLFTEGQSVKKGDVLAEIDPRPFAIQLHQAQASLARDTAQLDNARITLERDRALRQDGLNAQQDVDNQQAQVSQFEAGLKGDQAQIESARLNLDYARVRSPITGVTGARQVDAGNLVHAADPSGLVIVTQLDPMAVSFTLPQDDLPRVQRALAQGAVEVDVKNRDGAELLGKGTLTLIDNQVNAATATVRLKATVPNPERLLWPQQFVKVRVLVEIRRQALVVPAAAVQRGPDSALIYVVGADSTAQMRSVEVERVEDGLAIISKGIEPGDRVVVEGQSQLKPNAKVTAREQPAAVANGQQRKAGGTDRARSNAATSAAPSASAAPSGSAHAQDRGP
jgi:multidrug efflux system membrane fusion protein